MLTDAPVYAVIASLGLVLLVNAAPIAARWALGRRAAWAVDAGALAPDGRPWLGPSKTWRGVLVALAAGALAAPLLGYGVAVGLGIGLLAMLGDLTSSFIKRRLGIAPSGMALGLDQIPEALFPLLAVREAFGLSWIDVALETGAFVVLELGLSRLLYRLHLRKRPY